MVTDIDKMDEHLSHLSEEVRGLLKKHYDSLLQFNGSINLVPQSTIAHTSLMHFFDSVKGLEIILTRDPFTSPIYDLGSGNGFPGIVLAILRSDLNICLVEKDVRKVEFLKHLTTHLKLKNCKVLTQSVESLDKNSIEFGIVRGLGTLSNVTIQVSSSFKPGSILYHFKGESWPLELASCPSQIFAKWNIGHIADYLIPEHDIKKTLVYSKRLA